MFIECFREGGVLDKVESGRPGGFRAFLYGVVRNVALRFESKKARRRERSPATQFDFDRVERDEASLSRVFDRAWAASLLREAVQIHTKNAAEKGDAATRRVELLRLRFHESMPIREIARRWGVEATQVHREYAQARIEFKRALLEVVSFHNPGSGGEVERKCAELLGSLGVGV